MNIRAVCACLFRLIAFLYAVQFIATSLTPASLFPIAHSALKTSMLVELPLLAVLSGVLWILAPHLSQWAAAEARSPIEIGLKMGCVYFLFMSLASSVRIFTQWLVYFRNQQEPTIMVPYGPEDYHAFSGAALVLLAVLLLLLASPIGRVLTYSERLRTARESLEE